MTPKEVIAKLKEVQGVGGTFRVDVKTALDALMDKLTGGKSSACFYALEDLRSMIDSLNDKALQIKLRKILNAGENFLGKAEKLFLSIDKEL